MMGEFEHLVQEIAGQLSRRENEGVRSAEIPSLIQDSLSGEAVNCYPGVPGRCHEKLVLLSLQSKTYTAGGGHLSFRKALEYLVRHMQGSCSGNTQIAILITDNWDAKALDFWRPNIKQIQGTAFLEVYMMTGDNITKVTV